MKTIHFQGLNCYNDCVISIAGHFGLDYTAAFDKLWSETDFRYDPHRRVYMTKRMLMSLESLGARVENLGELSREEIAASFELFDEGEFVIIGIDAFYIPWSHFYKLFHGPHYFIIQNSGEETLLCTDPTYNREEDCLSRSVLCAHSFDISRVRRVREKPFQTDVYREAAEIYRRLPDTRRELNEKIQACESGEAEETVETAKYIDAMINNRYLYRHFLRERKNKLSQMFDKAFFLEWKALKNGLYKAAVSRDNTAVIEDISSSLDRVIEKERVMAESILSGF